MQIRSRDRVPGPGEGIATVRRQASLRKASISPREVRRVKLASGPQTDMPILVRDAALSAFRASPVLRISMFLLRGMAYSSVV